MTNQVLSEKRARFAKQEHIIMPIFKKKIKTGKYKIATPSGREAFRGSFNECSNLLNSI